MPLNMYSTSKCEEAYERNTFSTEEEIQIVKMQNGNVGKLGRTQQYDSNFRSKRLFKNMSPDVRERSRTEDDSDTWEGILKVFCITINIQ